MKPRLSRDHKIPSCGFPIHTFVLFLDTFTKEKDIKEVSLRVVEVLYAVLHCDNSKSGPNSVYIFSMSTKAL